MDAPVLLYPDLSLLYLLDIDASTERDGGSAVSGQGRARASDSLLQHQVLEAEELLHDEEMLAAMVKSLSPFHHYLYWPEFTMLTDYTALCWLKTLKELEGQFAR